MRCEVPNCRKKGQDIHHCWFKSHYYREDVNDYWNLVLLCRNCHNKIHHDGGGQLINYNLKRLAYWRRNKKDQAMKQVLKRLKIKTGDIRKVIEIKNKWKKSDL